MSASREDRGGKTHSKINRFRLIGTIKLCKSLFGKETLVRLSTVLSLIIMYTGDIELTGHNFFSSGSLVSKPKVKLPVKNFPTSAKMRRVYTINFIKPRSPTSSCAVGSGSSGPTSSPFASFSSRCFLRSSHSACKRSCSFLYRVYLHEQTTVR